MYMRLNLAQNLSRYPLAAKLYRQLTLRKAVQFAVAFIMLYAAWEFYHFVEYIRGSGLGPAPHRPPVAEGFLPIAAVLAFKALFALKEIDPIHPAGLMIFIATLTTAWVFRRALCSWICPISTLSETLGQLGRKLIGRNLNVPKWLDRLLLGIKYLLFFYVVKMILLIPTDEAVAFMKIPYYAVSDIKMFDMFMNLGVKALSIILVLAVLSVLIKSFWCRYLCPYGALLGVLGFLSPIFLTINHDTCHNCGACNRVCPNRVDVQGKKRLVASTECTGCTSCVSACPQKGTLQFKLFGLLPISPLVFSLGFLSLFFGIILWAKLTGHWETNLTIENYRAIDQMMSGGFGGM
ncbi:4Fe-4S ferredoxin iron-sulfur binding domain protein [Thermincola potens JR]|uniref:4Fe-4S ferredoxin iron-sulfur binding domain protein n=1 Tax=Thermincola potens (strain JR) TaxID=635013 RepID=D5X947_THEPJ|nr:4Fe-4S ferredoxin iron-sulfur binding domain protein [Thermincola potens JR]